MLFWIGRLRPDDAPAFDRVRYFVRTKEVLESLGRQGVFNNNSRQRIYLGKYDTQYLIEQDTLDAITGPRRTLFHACQHHLAWLFGLVCGVRPGTIVESRGREESGHYLRWRNVSIARCFDNGHPTGGLIAHVTFQWLKGNRDEASRKLERLMISFRSPRDPNLLNLSIPHRLLVLALHRGILADHTSVESLLAGHERVVSIIPDAQDLPVFVAAADVSKAVQVQPMTYGALSEYLKERTIRLGYPPLCTFYGFRAELATKVERRFGVESAQKTIQHAPGSHTYRKHYDKGNDGIDLVDLVIDGGSGLPEDGLESARESLIPALGRVDHSEEEQANRNAISAFLQDHPQVLACEPGSTAWKRTRASLRKHAERALLAAQWEEKSKLLSGAVIAERAQALQKTDLREVLKRAVERSNQELDDQVPADALVDLERILRNQGSTPDQGVELSVDNEETDQQQSASDQDLVLVWMQTLTNPGFAAPLPNAHLTQRSRQYSANYGSRYSKKCQLCVHDETVTASDRGKDYVDAAALSEHISSFFHAPIARFTREIESKIAQSSEKRVDCPYGCGNTFSQASDLIKHVENDSGEPRSEAHEEAKREDGWLLAGFYEYKSTVSMRRQATKKRKRDAMSDSLRNAQQIVSMPVVQPALLAKAGMQEFVEVGEEGIVKRLTDFAMVLR